jgi:Carboxypeptidase regulatory-like domain
MMRKFVGLFALLSLSLGIGLAQVQAGLGALSGIVTDPTKAAVPNAKVMLTNAGIGLHKETTTNGDGEFQFTALTVVGGYHLEVVAPGFTHAVVSDIATSVGTVITQNVTLNVGSESTTVEVSAGNIEQVQVDTSSVSQLIDSTVWQTAPLSVRSSNTFVGLVAGAASDSANTGRGFAVNGARTGTGNFMVDGFDNNDQGLGGGGANGGGGGVATISPDAIQEYRVITSVPNAEYGRAGGFATDTVLKSGTNKWHGSLFEYNRIQALAQNNWFSNHTGLRDHLVRNQFGGSVGGPIYKDKTFFYATAEFQRQSTGNPVTYTGITQDFYNFVQSGQYEKWNEGTILQNSATIPDPNQPGNTLIGEGFCPVYLGAPCPGQLPDLGKLGPVFSGLYAKFPQQFAFGTRNFSNAPTDLFLGDTSYLPVNIYGDGDVIQQENYSQNRGSMKLDHKLTEHDQLSFTYLVDFDTDSLNNGGGGATPGPAYAQVGGAQIFGARWTHTFTPNLLNDFKAGYNRHVSNFAAPGTQGIPEMYTADSLYTGFGATSGFPQLFTENAFSYEDAVTYVHSKHTFKTGFRFIRTRNGSSFYNDVNGTLGFWGAAGIMTDGLNEQDMEALAPGFASYGSLYTSSASLDPTTNTAPDPYRGYRANEFAAYVQDDWKATQRLTLNYGLRWDYFGPPHNFRAGVDSNVYFGTGTTLPSYLTNPFTPNVPLLVGESGATFQYAQSNGRSTIWDRDVNNLGPRLGFAYDTLGNGKLVLRGGFGIGYDRLYNNVYENIRFNGPRFVDNSYGGGPYTGNGTITPALRASLVQVPFVGNVALSVAGAAPVPRHVDQNLKTAYYEQAHFGVESQLPHGFVLEANYIGTFGRQLVGIMNANTFEGRVACTSTSGAQGALCKAAGYTTLSSARPSPLFSSDNFRTNGFSSNYNAGQLSLRRGYSNGLQFSGNYTYSKAMDQISDVFTVKGGATGIVTPYNPSASYGPADFDVRHQATFTATYETHSATHKMLLAGWSLSPILQMHSGTPIYMKDSSSSYSPNKTGTTGVEWIVYNGAHPRDSINHSVSPAGNGNPGSGWIKSGNWVPYVCPASVNKGLFCDPAGDRNAFNGLRQYKLDAALSKHLNLTERFSLTLQAAFFDIDGHVRWGNPSGDINSTSFGQSTSAGGREGQLSGRIDF